MSLSPLPRLIPSPNPEDEVWNYIGLLTSSDYIVNLLRDRIDTNFFKFGEHIEGLNRKKLIYCSENSPGDIEIHEKLEMSDNLKANAREIVALTKQSIELYRSSKQESLYSKPITLYYSYAKLARVLFLSTYKSKKGVGNHGLSLLDSKTIACKRTGGFARFHDSYNWNPSVYLKGYMFKWQDLISNPQLTSVFSLILNMKDRNVVHLNERKSNIHYIEHELTREYLFLFAMSYLARYKVDEWDKLMSGSVIMWDIQNYLASTQILYPNLIFNQLHGEQFYFYPSEPMGMTMIEARGVPISPDWIL